MTYITVQWVTESPVARREGWGHIVFLTSGTQPSQCSSNPQLVTPSDYTEYVASNSYENIAYGSYVRNLAGTPTNNSYIYWMGDGKGITGIAEAVTDVNYKINLAPFASIDGVYIDPTGGSNWQEIGLAPEGWSSGQTGYRPGSGSVGIYDGNIYFTGEALDGGPFLESGGTTYSGDEARDIIEASGGLIRVLATQNGFGVAQEDLKDYDVQFIVPLYNTAGDGTGLMSTPAYNDLRNALVMAGGNRRMVIWALPKDSAPNTEYIGTSYDYNQFRNYIGQDQNAITYYADVLTGSTSTGLDDPAAALAGRICATHPHTSQSLDTINISLAKVEDENAKLAWDAGQIICTFKQTQWGFDTTQLNYGFTFAGTSPSNRLNNVRCKYIVLINVLQDLWSLLSTRTVNVTKSGCNTVIETLNGTLDRLLSQGIIDPDSDITRREVDVPLLRGTAAEWANANLYGTIPAVIVRWPWRNTVESIVITEFGEII